jgi:LmbE family N-acetylglucosaminyl deacetylase
MVVVAHPDDADFWAGGTIAIWTDSGIVVTYLVLTDGDAGGFDPGLPRNELPATRRAEQRTAAGILGVHDVRFLGWREGTLRQCPELRRGIVRVIRQVRPQRLLTWSPEWNWQRFRSSCHADHRVSGELALTAAYPEAGNQFAHPELLRDEGLEPWMVSEFWLINSPRQNHYVDVTDVVDRKLDALRAHKSQTTHGLELAKLTRERMAPNAVAAGLPADRLAEAFQVVLNA